MTTTITNKDVINLQPKKIILGIGALIFLLALVSLSGQLLRHLTDYENAFGLIPLVDMVRQLSVATILRVLLLFMNALLLGVIAAVEGAKGSKLRGQWMFLAAAFFYMSLHAGSNLHNLVMSQLLKPLRSLFPALTITRLGLTVALLALIVVTFFRGFILALPKRTKLLLLASLALYLAAFWGVNTLITQYVSVYGDETLGFNLWWMAKKIVEMGAMLLSLYTWLDFLEKEQAEFEFEFQKPEPALDQYDDL